MAFLIQKICLLLITILLLNIVFLPPLTIFMPKPLLSLVILNNRKHYPPQEYALLSLLGPRNCSQDEAGLRETHQMTGPQLTQNLQPFTSCSQRKQNIKPTLKSHAQFQWMQMTDRHLLTTLRASSPTFSGTRARGISYDTLGLSPNSVFPKGFSSMSRMTQESCFTEITNCKLFFFF